MTNLKMIELTDSSGDRVMVFINSIAAIEDCTGIASSFTTRIYLSGHVTVMKIREDYDLVIKTIREELN